MWEEESAKLDLSVSLKKTKQMHVDNDLNPPLLLFGPDAMVLVQQTLPAALIGDIH